MRYALILLLLLVGCSQSIEPQNYRDAIAVDAAMATIDQSPMPAPTPAKCAKCGETGQIIHGDGHKTPCPDCTDGAAGPERTGPIDSIRQVKDLVAKGNALADRGKAILDAAEKQGEIVVKVQMPKSSRPSSQPPQTLLIPPIPFVIPPPYSEDEGQEADNQERSGCEGGSCNAVPDGWYFGKRLGRRR